MVVADIIAGIAADKVKAVEELIVWLRLLRALLMAGIGPEESPVGMKMGRRMRLTITGRA